MPDCKEYVYSNDYYDILVPYGDARRMAQVSGGCVQQLPGNFDVLYYPREGGPKLNIDYFTYGAIPKLYGLLDQTALEASGIIRLQDQPALALKGNGVMVGFIDTGIDYTNNLFRYSSGATRILRIWDQSIMDGTPPANFFYGAEYTEEEINRALDSDNPYEIVPSRDEDGHGTFLAGVACGSEDISNAFIGAAPQAGLAIVKLKQAKQYLRDFYFIPDDELAFQESDIMLAVSYLNDLANEYNMPLVICLAVGNSMGSHGKNGPLSSLLNEICVLRRRVVVVASGNEANARRHYQGQITGDIEYENVEISVEEDMPGFFVELWATAPELYAVSVISPTGEELPRIPARPGITSEFQFLFEGTLVSIDYRQDTKESANQLIFFRFTDAKRGLWTIRVFPQDVVNGQFSLWLPMQRFSEGTVYFLRSNPDITLTSPASARQVITVGGYNHITGSMFADSGRGYTTSGEIKPDFVAPAVDIYGPGLRGNFIRFTGTSAAAAITTGACAQIVEWAIVKRNQQTLTNAGVKNILIRGTDQPVGRSFPNREWGYGSLNVYQAFERLRV